MFIAFLLSRAFASSAETIPGNPTFQEVPDVVTGTTLVDVVDPEMECSSGVVLVPTTADGGIEVRELHGGAVRDDDLHVTDRSVQALLAPGQKVVVYRSARGISVFGAS